MNNQTLPRKLVEAQQRAAEERGDPTPVERANATGAITDAIEDVTIMSAIQHLVAQNKQLQTSPAPNTMYEAAQQELKLDKDSADALLKYFRQLGWFRPPAPLLFPPIQQRGEIIIHRMDVLGGHKPAAWQWLNDVVVGQHKEKHLLPQSSDNRLGGFVFWWDDIEDRNTFLEFAGRVAHRVQERYGHVPVIRVTASIDAIF